ncbi:MAG TPA: hypothetical protein VKZ50_09240 [bacterium]|nr:hypothetical protein [bacterium]
MVARELKRRLGCLALAIPVVAAALMTADAAPLIPTSDQVVDRLLNANAGGPSVAAADVRFKFRLNKPVTEPPDCEFDGTIQLVEGRQQVSIGRSTGGFQCWVLNKFMIGRLFQGTEPPSQFLARFEFWVLGWRLVEGHPFYLVEGTARNPKNNPRGMIGWIDYDRGLVTDGTLRYAWGDIDSVQRYQRMSGAWVLVYQYLETSRFGASMEAQYSNFQFGTR